MGWVWLGTGVGEKRLVLITLGEFNNVQPGQRVVQQWCIYWRKVFQAESQLWSLQALQLVCGVELRCSYSRDEALTELTAFTLSLPPLLPGKKPNCPAALIISEALIDSIKYRENTIPIDPEGQIHFCLLCL